MALAERIDRKIPQSLRDKFNIHKDIWLEDTRVQSSLHEITRHHDYKAILKMGITALPLIFESLENDENAQWFHALVTITGRDIAEGYEVWDKARIAWLDQGYRWGLIVKGNL